ncbi:hypothetical protein ES707_06875 [subsurface metagenome]
MLTSQEFHGRGSAGHQNVLLEVLTVGVAMVLAEVHIGSLSHIGEDILYDPSSVLDALRVFLMGPKHVPGPLQRLEGPDLIVGHDPHSGSFTADLSGAQGSGGGRRVKMGVGNL